MADNETDKSDIVKSIREAVFAIVSEETTKVFKEWFRRPDVREALTAWAGVRPRSASCQDKNAKEHPVCSEPGCDRPARSRGLCSKHYQRLRYREKKAKGNTDNAPLVRGFGECSVDGCTERVYARVCCYQPLLYLDSFAAIFIHLRMPLGCRSFFTT